MITKIVLGDIFSTALQTGESPGQPIDIIVGTNQTGVNTRGLAHEIGQRFNLSFQNLLQGHREKEVALGHVFSGEGMIETQEANFHAIAVNRRNVPGGSQDWSGLLHNLSKGLNYLHLNQNTYDDPDVVEDVNFVDAELRDKIAGISIQEGVDYAGQISAIVEEHIESTRRKYRVVLIGGADGRRHNSDLQKSLEAFELSPLTLHLYLGNAAHVARAVNKVIPHIPTLCARELMVRAY